MKKTTMIILVVVTILIGLVIINSTGNTKWTWKLSTDNKGWNDVVFTQAQLNCCTNDNPVNVLQSIDQCWDFIFDSAGKNYWHNQGASLEGGTLQHILPNVTYQLHVTQDCILIINKC